MLELGGAPDRSKKTILIGWDELVPQRYEKGLTTLKGRRFSPSAPLGEHSASLGNLLGKPLFCSPSEVEGQTPAASATSTMKGHDTAEMQVTTTYMQYTATEI